MLTAGGEAPRMRSGANRNASNGSARVSGIGIDGRDRRRSGALRILLVRSRQAQANGRENCSRTRSFAAIGERVRPGGGHLFASPQQHSAEQRKVAAADTTLSSSEQPKHLAANRDESLALRARLC